MPHDVDVHGWCVRCGQSQRRILEERLECRDGVIAITHIVRGRRLDSLLDAVLKQMEG